MKKNRVEAFSDGVIAIIITIMVLELKPPENGSISSLLQESPVFLSYLISFLYVGIYWNSHHHTFQLVKKVNGKILWANLHFLFWLSLLPFATSWIGEKYTLTGPSIFYGVILLMCALSGNLLTNAIMKHHEEDFSAKKIFGNRMKEKVSLVLYTLGVVLSFFSSFAGIICYIIAALIWVVPDKRIENKIH